MPLFWILRITNNLCINSLIFPSYLLFSHFFSLKNVMLVNLFAFVFQLMGFFWFGNLWAFLFFFCSIKSIFYYCLCRLCEFGLQFYIFHFMHIYFIFSNWLFLSHTISFDFLLLIYRSSIFLYSTGYKTFYPECHITYFQKYSLCYLQCFQHCQMYIHKK